MPTYDLLFPRLSYYLRLIRNRIAHPSRAPLLFSSLFFSRRRMNREWAGTRVRCHVLNRLFRAYIYGSDANVRAKRVVAFAGRESLISRDW